MKGKTAAAVRLLLITTRRAPRLAAALVLALAVILGGAGIAGAGIAGAATGAAFILGRANSESSTAALSSSRGTALSLSAPRHKAPLAVNRRTLVKNLNAQYVGGLAAASAKLTGGTGFAPLNADISITTDVFTKVAGTGRVPAGTYYVQASALVDLTTGDTGSTCVIEENSNGIELFGGGGGDGENFVQAAETVVLRLKSRGDFQEMCIVDGTNSGTEVIDAGIIAVRILSSSGRPPLGGSLTTRRVAATN